MSAGLCLAMNSAISSKLSSAFVVSCLLLLLILHLVGQSNGLRMTSMNTPVLVDVRENMELECHYDMGQEELYAVKWYKNDNEFFRYIPNPQPHTMLYPVAGVQLEPRGTNCSLGFCKVKLQKLSKASGGAYRCEVSGEGPEFHLASETHNVTVAALPREKPRIEGLTTSYMEGDTVAVKCISDLADPAPILTWYINGQPAPSTTVGERSTTKPNPLGLVSRTISLHLLVDQTLRQANNLEIRCESSHPGIPIPPQVTTHTIALLSPNERGVNNQKLHWFSSASSCVQTLKVAWFWGVIFMVRCSV